MEINNAGEITQENVNPSTSHTAGADIDMEKSLGDNDGFIGKFKSTKALYDAYNSLQSEFTRRCQKIKELERENERLSMEKTTAFQESSLGENGEKIATKTNFSQSKECVELASDTPLQVNCKEEELSKSSQESDLKNLSIDELKGIISQNEEVKNWIIHGYLKNLESSKPTAKLMTGNGQSVVSPPLKPVTLVDAGKLARQIFENKEIIK